MSNARDFIDFWIQNSVHAAEQYGSRGGVQESRDLADRCIEMAKSQDITVTDIEAEVGDLANYIHARMKRVNEIEDDRTDRHRS